MKKFMNKFIRHTKDEQGNATVEFVLVVPTFLLLFVSIFELGMATVRLTVLEHGMDETMRAIRLSTGAAITHEEIRDTVCINAGLLKECDDRLLVEMVVIDRDSFALPPVRANCIDMADEAEPVVDFTSGGDSDLMFIRACFVVEPIFPTMGLGAMIPVDDSGNMMLVASSIFAQEPQ